MATTISTGSPPPSARAASLSVVRWRH